MDREGLIKEFSLKIASKVVREFEGNDNYTVHDLRNYTELLLNELVSKNELLHLVSQHRELLRQYNGFTNMQYQGVGLDDTDIDDFMDWLNCG